MNIQGPNTQHMNEGAPMGENGWGSTIAKTMTNKHAFSIKHMIPRAGCCYCPTLLSMCCPSLQGRGYVVIGDNYFEQNNPCVCVPWCCCTYDFISKVYYDKQPFAETICEKFCACIVGDGKDNFVTEHDTCYCCYCISCMPVYEILCRPCVGGRLGRATCSRSNQCCFFCGTRCCGICCITPIANYIDDSLKCKQIMETELNRFRAVGGADYALN